MFKEAGVKGDVNVGGVVTRDGLENVRELFRKHLMFGFHWEYWLTPVISLLRG